MKAILIDRVRVITLAAIFLAAFTPSVYPLQETQAARVNDYRIGPKDLLEITVFELPELNQTVRVSEDGSITLSLLGKVGVSGSTAQELETRLAQLLDQQYTKGAHVTVFIREYQKVSVIGAVGRPGMYELVGPTTLLQAIAQAGGTTEWAKKSRVVVKRRDKRTDKEMKIRVNLKKMISGKIADIVLMEGDVVIVP